VVVDKIIVKMQLKMYHRMYNWDVFFNPNRISLKEEQISRLGFILLQEDGREWSYNAPPLC
jgi:hypothetical protein